MALLPLAGWALEDVTVTPVTFTKPYGYSETVTVNMFTCSPAVSAQEKQAIAAKLTLVRIDEGQDVNTAEGYRYYFEKTGNTENSTIFVASTEGRLRISKLNLSNPGQNSSQQDIHVNVTLDPNADVSWTGQAIEPTVTVSISGLDIDECNGNLTENTHYTLEITNNINPNSSATATVTAKDNTNFSGTKVVDNFFVVGKPSIQNASVTFKNTFAPKFTGGPITVQASDIDKVIVQYPNMEPQELATTEWGIVANGYENNVEAADKTAENAPKVKLQGTNDHEGTIMVPFTIAPATDINIVTFNNINDLTYTGKTAEPVVTAYIELGNNNQYDDNVDYLINVAGEFDLATTNQDVTDAASVTVTGKGKNFATTATKALSYKINPFNLANADVTIDNVEYSANPQEVAPTLTIGTGDDAIIIPASSSYTLSYKDAEGNAQNSEDYNVTKIQNGIKVVATANANTNYTGSTPAFDANNVIKYNITAKAITITAAEFTVGHGADLPVSVSMDEKTLVGNDTWALLTANVDLTNTNNYKFYNDNNGEKGNATANNEVPTDKGFYWYELKDDALTSPTAANYTITPVAARFEITTAQVIARVKTKNDVVYGTDATQWDLEYVSGLGTNAAATATFNTIKGGLNISDNDFAFVDQTLNCTPITAAWLNVVDGNGYEVKYTGTQTYGNYQISVQNGYLKPVAKELNEKTGNDYNVAIQINGGNAITYAGAVPAQTTAWTATYNNHDVKDQLDIAYDEDFNVGARTALVTPKTGNKNFVATRVVQQNNTDVTVNNRPVAYNIGVANLTIKADDKLNWVYGSPNNDPLSFTATGLVGADKGINLADADVAAAHDFTGAVKVDINGSDGVGTHAGALVPSGITASTNYQIEWVNGNLVVDYNTVTVKIKDQTITYGNAPEAFELEVVGDNITDEQKASINQIINWTKATNYDAADMKDVKAYEINATDADAATATNYHVNEILPGSLTIQKRPVTFTAKSYVKVDENTDNRIAYGNLDAWLADLSVSATYIDVTSGSIAANATYNNGEDITDLIATIAPKTTIIGVDNVLELTKFTDGVARNYDITTVNGVLQLTDEGVGELVFNSADIDSEKITDFHGVVKNVKINFTPRNSQTINTNYGTWKAGFWNTLVLPFDISVADLSKALGYAIVNVIDPAGRSLDSNGNPVFKFKLTMKGGNGSAEVLKANKPFVVKLADDIKTVDGNDDPYYYDFGQQTIVAPQNADDLTLDAGFDCKFVGTYTTTGAGKDSEGAGKYWFLVGDYDTKWIYSSKSEWNIVPFAAYIDLSNMDPEKAREATFIMEEIDGSTTTIKSANIDDVKSLGAEGWYNLNGMKMNGAPAQKGVFIQNGKKVVIK